LLVEKINMLMFWFLEVMNLQLSARIVNENAPDQKILSKFSLITSIPIHRLLYFSPPLARKVRTLGFAPHYFLNNS